LTIKSVYGECVHGFVLLLACFQTQELIDLYPSEADVFSARGVEINAFTPDNPLSMAYSPEVSPYRSVSRETAASERRRGLISRTRLRIYSVSFHTFILSFSLTDRQTACFSSFSSLKWPCINECVWSRVSWAFSSQQKHKQSLPPHTHTHTHTHTHAFSLSLSQIPLAQLWWK